MKIKICLLLIYFLILLNIYIKHKILIYQIKNKELLVKKNNIEKYIKFINLEIEIYENT